jgi:DNA polymerase
MDSTADASELLDLARQLRAQLERHAGQGAWAAPGGPTARLETGVPEIIDEPSASRMTLAQVREELGNCTRCKLHTTRTNLVFGVGAEDAVLMFVGEAPGEKEDLKGEPFVGPAGQLLDKMIEAMGWRRESVYIANVLKSRPPGNRNPEPDEVAACSPFLDAQIRAIAPRVIVALGKPAAQHLLKTTAPISALRGTFHDRAGVRVMPTYHPAYLLREPTKKREAWSDLKLVMAELDRLGIVPPHAPA